MIYEPNHDTDGPPTVSARKALNAALAKAFKPLEQALAGLAETVENKVTKAICPEEPK